MQPTDMACSKLQRHTPMNLLCQGTAFEDYLPKLNQGTEAGYLLRDKFDANLKAYFLAALPETKAWSFSFMDY
jgi:hypothetical protein